MQDERVAVFEEDARIDSASAARFKTLYEDLLAEPWYATAPHGRERCVLTIRFREGMWCCSSLDT